MILLLGPSASGKTEIAKILCKDFHFTKTITSTTRPMRKGEVQGVDYHFLTEKEFLRLNDEGAFVETTLFNGYHYGSSKDEIGDDKVLIVDVPGYLAYKALQDPRIISFFIDCPEEERIAHMKHRGDEEEAIASRIEHDKKAFPDVVKDESDCHIMNVKTSLEELAKKIAEIYEAKLRSMVR
ncbi:MAG: hypothetical protein SPG64_04515 [Candidatus Enteromonas sp.]|nr:hypothetical protein [Candidatus Enteromonas sp.]